MVTQQIDKRVIKGSVFLAVLLIGCSEGLQPMPIELCSDNQEVAVSVTSEPRPLFTWDPACGMASLEVRPVSGSQSSGWELFTGPGAPGNPLRSRIRYGSAPPEAQESDPATPLAEGVEYRITVSRWIGDAQDGNLILRGSTTFVQ
jgi:hypothetical protein